MSRTFHHSKRYWKGRKADFYRDAGWCMREPKHWRKLYKQNTMCSQCNSVAHRKRRAATKRKLYEASISEENAEDAIFPLDAKPWIYYY